MAAARRGRPSGGVSDRPSGAVLHAAAAGIDGAAEEIAWLLTREQGKPFRDSLKEVRFGAEVFRFYADEAMRLHAEVRPSYADAEVRAGRTATGRDRRRDRAVELPGRPVVLEGRRRLAAGNAVIVKPPLETPLAVGAVVRQLDGVGLPAGCCPTFPVTPASARRW